MKFEKQTLGCDDMIHVIFFSLLFAVIYLLLERVLTSVKSNKYRKRTNQIAITKDYSFEKLFSRFNFLKAKDNFLSKQGYPLHLNVISYYFAKILLGMFLFLAASVNYGSFVMAVIFALLGYFVIDIYIILNKKTRDNEICVDLLNVVDSMSLQLSAEVTLKDSLKKQFENCKNKDFRKAILEFATQYELSELNINESLNELKEKFDILELNMFCNSLGQFNKVGNIIEILDNLSEMLKVKYLEKLKNATRTKVLYITFGVIIALGNMIMLTLYPLFISVGQGFSTIYH